MNRRSVTLRLISLVIPAQILALAIGWALIVLLDFAGIRSSNWTSDDFAYDRTKALLIASLIRADDGGLRIEPTAALREEMARVPTLKLAVFDLSRNAIAQGSSAELTRLVDNPSQIALVAANFYLPKDGKRSASGVVDTSSTALGDVRTAIHGMKMRWEDPWLVLGSTFSFFWPYVLVAILLCSAGTLLAVRRGLSPLRQVATDAAQIEVDKLNQRLSDSGVPIEILPLVHAFNDALERLDSGVGRLRRFTANAAHELRTPVAVLEARLDNFDIPTIKNDLRRDARRIRVLVEQLLASARLARSNRPQAIVDLIAVCQAVVDDFALLAVRQRKTIEFRAQMDRLETLGEKRGLESVIANLLDNALRAEPEGGTVILHVGADAILEVVDHGEGIEEADREPIFEPFWRKSEASPGSGLGLAIAKELMDALGGKIWVEETPGGGATFKLSFPRVVDLQFEP